MGPTQGVGNEAARYTGYYSRWCAFQSGTQPCARRLAVLLRKLPENRRLWAHTSAGDALAGPTGRMSGCKRQEMMRGSD